MAALDDEGSLGCDRRDHECDEAPEEQVNCGGGHPLDETGVVREVGDEDESRGARPGKAVPAAVAEVDPPPPCRDSGMPQWVQKLSWRTATGFAFRQLFVPSLRIVDRWPHRLEPE